jgi:16S rRNA processing protein RimM
MTARIEEIWNHDGRPVFKFAGVDSISDAEPWAGADVLVPESEKVAPEEGEYSHADLIGCSVVSGADPVGVVTGIEDYGGPSLLKLQSPDGREILIPFVGAICREIDITAKVIRVDLPDGLLEI